MCFITFRLLPQHLALGLLRKSQPGQGRLGQGQGCGAGERIELAAIWWKDKVYSAGGIIVEI